MVKGSRPLLALAIVVLGAGLALGIAVSGVFSSDAESPMADSDGREPTAEAGLLAPQAASADQPVVSDTGRSTEAEAAPVVEPDPDYEAEILSAGLSTRGWKTDFSRHTVPYAEIRSGGVPRDGIPPIDLPRFTAPQEAKGWLGDKEPVIALQLNGEARAYPLQIMTWHEIVNDVVGGVPVAVTFCPLCNSAIVFERTLDGVVYDFGTTGKLRNSDLVMWDRQTESWWQQLSGESIVGRLSGKALELLPASIISFHDFREAFPQGEILSRSTGFSRPYGENPYVGYDDADRPPFLLTGEPDGRLPPKERVVAVTIGDTDVAFPFSLLEKERVVEHAVNGQDLVVFFESGTTSALDRASIRESRDVGATGVFDPNVDGRKLTFRAEGDGFVDNETGSVWDIVGRAVEGPLEGSWLEPIVHGNHFWFAWGVFKPDTLIYRGMG